jgi:aminoglycoside phosphotransferase (APT) family kinase protein
VFRHGVERQTGIERAGVTGGTVRDDDSVAAGLAAWWTNHYSGVRGVEVIDIRRPSDGRSNETILATIATRDDRRAVALRLPTVEPSFPTHDLGAQAAVQAALLANGIPAATPIAFEPDERWLGTPFLVMNAVGGRSVGDAPALDRWLSNAGQDVQRRVHAGFANVLGDVHHLDWQQAGLDQVLRGAHGGLAAEIQWWLDYLDWAADGTPHPRLLSIGQWCKANVPTSEPPSSLCWGDARVGNVLYDDLGNVPPSIGNWRPSAPQRWMSPGGSPSMTS